MIDYGDSGSGTVKVSTQNIKDDRDIKFESHQGFVKIISSDGIIFVPTAEYIKKLESDNLKYRNKNTELSNKISSLERRLQQLDNAIDKINSTAVFRRF